MTKAYIMGFRKAAEAHGVDPDTLVKVANKIKATINGVNTLAALTGEPILRGGKEIARPMLNLSKIRKGLASGTLPAQVKANFQAILDASGRVKGYERNTRSLLRRWLRAEGAPASKIKAVDTVPAHYLAGPRATVGTNMFVSDLEREMARGQVVEPRLTPQKARIVNNLFGRMQQNSREAKSLLDFLNVSEADRAAIGKSLWRPVPKKPVGPKIKRRK